jgi:hypothetical protein
MTVSAQDRRARIEAPLAAGFAGPAPALGRAAAERIRHVLEAGDASH